MTYTPLNPRVLRTPLFADDAARDAAQFNADMDIIRRRGAALLALICDDILLPDFEADTRAAGYTPPDWSIA